MFNNSIIQKLIAGIILILFAFSITPKKILHDLVANHKDTPTNSNTSTTKQINPATINCDCDNLVVESPFFYQNNIIQIMAPVSYLFLTDNNIYTLYYQNHFDLELRGPPFTIS